MHLLSQVIICKLAFWKDQDHQERFKAPTDSDSEEDNEDSELQLRRLSVVSGPFEGPTVYEPENQLKEELTRQEQDFEEIIISILKNMRKHKENEDVYRYGTAALENIASRSGCLLPWILTHHISTFPYRR